MDIKGIEKAYNSIKDKPWFPYLLLILITGLAAGLRFYKLSVWSFWIDEIYTINRAKAHYSSIELTIQNIPPIRNWIPLSTILTAQVINQLGVSEWSARLVSAVVGIITIPLLYFPMRKLFNVPVTLIALLLLAVSPWHIFWSQNARFYTSLMLMSTLALFTFYWGIERNRPVYLILFYVLLYFSLSERLFGILILPIIFLYLFLLLIIKSMRPPGFNRRNLFLFFTPIVIFLLLLSINFLSTGSLLFYSVIEELNYPIGSPIRLLILIILSIGIPVAATGFFSGLYFLQNIERLHLFIVIAALLPVILLAIMNPFVFTVERYALVTFPFWLIMSALGIQKVFSFVNQKQTILMFGIIFIFLLDAGINNLMYYQINHGNRLNWRDAAGFVRENVQDSDVVISTRPELASYYFQDDVLDYTKMLPKDFQNINSEKWFIIDYPGVWHGNKVSKEWMETHTNLVNFSFLRVPEEMSILIYRSTP
jgi:mannosyltransferase